MLISFIPKFIFQNDTNVKSKNVAQKIMSKTFMPRSGLAF